MRLSDRALAPASGEAPGGLPELGTGSPSALDLLLSKGRMRATLAMLGPAFVASVAYVDPGNFATDFQGGARSGYLLLWVVLTANVIAMLIQYLSAKLGIVTGCNLAENFRAHYPRVLTWGMWAQAEIVAMSTDIAEFIGGAIGLNLLFAIPLFPASLITGAIAFALLGLHRFGLRSFELAICGLMGIIFLGFLYETLRIGPSAHSSLDGLLPRLGGTSSLYLTAGIIGATVMPHAIYLHSALTQDRVPCRDDGERSRVLRFERTDVIIALGLAGLVNMAMLAAAAKLFHTPALSGLSTLQQAHRELGHLAGGTAALAFAIALLASGASSSSVGSYAGQVVMAGFVKLRISLMARRGLTMIPALTIVAAGMNPTHALVLSQVVLSFGIPFALVPLVMLTCRPAVMGAQVNRCVTTILAWSCAAMIVGMNIFLICQQFFLS
jgi:manganese transport protein